MSLKALIAQWGSVLYVGFLSLIISIVLARTLGPAIFAEYATAMALGSSLMIFIDGGFRTLLTRESVWPSESLLIHAADLPKFALGHALIASCFAGALAWILFPANRSLALATVACFFSVVITQFVSAKLRGEGQFKLDASWQIFQRSVSAVFIFCWVLFGIHAPWQIMLGWAIGSIGASLLVPYGIRYFPRAELRVNLYKAMLPLLLIDLATSVYFRSDIVVLKFLDISDVEIGSYAGAYRLVEAIILIANPISLMLFRKFRQSISSEKSGDLGIYKSMLLASIAGVVFAVIVFWSARVVVNFVYGDHYEAAITMLRVLSWALLFVMPNAILTQAALALGLEWQYALAAGLAACVNISMNFILVSQLGVQAAALVTIFTEAVLFAILAGCVSIKIRDMNAAAR